MKLLPAVAAIFFASAPLMGQDGDANAAAPPAAAASASSTAPAKQNFETSSLPNPFEDPRDRIYYPGDTESFKPLMGKLLGNVLLDQKEIWTSPFHMHKKDAGWWIGFGAVTAALVATDHRTINTFENSPGQIAWGNHISNVGAEYTLIPLTAGFYIYGALAHNAQAREVGVLGGESLLDGLIVVEVLKTAAGRKRPDSANTGDRGEFFDGGASFPSGHAMESWALASLIAHEYKRYGGKWVPYLAYTLATGVSLSRFAAQRHYASDIVAGAAMGWFIGRYVYQTHEDHAGHKHAFAMPRITPEVDPVTRSYAVAVGFGARAY